MATPNDVPRKVFPRTWSDRQRRTIRAIFEELKDRRERIELLEHRVGVLEIVVRAYVETGHGPATLTPDMQEPAGLPGPTGSTDPNPVSEGQDGRYAQSA